MWLTSTAPCPCGCPVERVEWIGLKRWWIHPLLLAPVSLLFLVIDLSFFTANMTKFGHRS